MVRQGDVGALYFIGCVGRGLNHPLHPRPCAAVGEITPYTHGRGLNHPLHPRQWLGESRGVEIVFSFTSVP